MDIHMLTCLNRHEAVRLEHGGKLMALLLRLHTSASKAGAEVLDILLMPRRGALALCNAKQGLLCVGLALITDKTLVACSAQSCSPELMEAALARAAALAPRTFRSGTRALVS